MIKLRMPGIIENMLFATVLTCICGAAMPAAAQTRGAVRPEGTKLVPPPKMAEASPMAKERELLCGGYLRVDPPKVAIQIAGAEQEVERRMFAQGNFVYVDGGRKQGLEEGQIYSVIRPRGNFKSPWSDKGKLGIYTQELGRLKIVRVEDKTSVAQVEQGCEAITLGDLVVPVPDRPAPVVQLADRIDRFEEPSGKATGKIVLSRDNLDIPSVNNVVFIDLGSQENLKPGDVLLIIRNPRTNRIVPKHDGEMARNSRSGYESFVYKGSPFSLDATRTNNSKSVESPNITTPQIRSYRPAMPRKVVGEMVVTEVEQRSAAAIITRVTEEVHAGDFVELQ